MDVFLTFTKLNPTAAPWMGSIEKFVSRNFTKFKRKSLFQSLFFSKVEAFRSIISIIKSIAHAVLY